MTSTITKTITRSSAIQTTDPHKDSDPQWIRTPVDTRVQDDVPDEIDEEDDRESAARWWRRQ